MDHLAFAELLGNYGEFVGSIAVIFTLLYLARQIRQNTLTQRSAIIQNWTNETQGNNQLLINSETIWPIIFKARDGLHALDIVDRQRFRYFFTQLFNGQEAMYLQFQMGVIEKDYYESRMKQLEEMLQHDGINEFWQRYSHTLYTKGFIEEIERLANEWGISLQSNADQDSP